MRKISVMQRKPTHATNESTLFAVSEDEWDTKEDTGKSMYVLQHAKGPSQAKGMSSNEKLSP